MHTIYNLVVGPLTWLAGVVFVFGSIYRLVSMYLLAKKKDPFLLEYMDCKYGLRSIIHWLAPFVPVNSRRHPVITVITFLFHLCLIFTPIFLLAHVVLLETYHGLSFWTFPEALSDVMAALVVGACIFFGVRRALLKEVRYVTSAMDWVVLVMVFLPFLTGFLAYHQIGPYQVILIIHMLSGQVMLAAIPFTRLSHMLFAAVTRAYMGSEFGAVRQARDW